MGGSYAGAHVNGWKGLQMHNLIGAACRRTAGMAAGVILCGGIAGGVLLTPGTAFADTAVATATAITGTAQSPDSAGTTTLNVRVAVTPGGPGSHSTAYVKIVPRGWWWAF
jgi:hypothetical protein